MGQRVAVQQQQRRAIAAVAQMDARVRCRDLGAGEPFEHDQRAPSGAGASG